MIMQTYTSNEIIPDSIEIHCEIHGTTIMRQTGMKLFCTTIDQNLNLISILTIYIKILQGKLI